MAGRKRARMEVSASAFCDLCQVAVSSESQWALHAAGKRHQQNLTVRQTQQEEAKRCVFVRNFPNGKTSADDLRGTFEVFGPVKKVILKDKAVFAIVEFESAETASDVLQRTEPICVHSTRLLVKPRIVKELLLTPQPAGRGECERTDSKRVKKDQRVANKKPDFSLEKAVLEAMHVAKSIDEQADILMLGSQLTSYETQERYQLCSSLQSILRPTFPYCVVLPFGSSVTGLAFKGADLDICLLTEILPVDMAAAYSVGVRSVEKGGENIERSQECALTDSITVLQTVSRWLRQDGAYDRVRLLTDTKCPIVQFSATDMHLVCDLSFGNRLALQNTQLLVAYISSLPSVLPFLFSLRCWAMSKRLVAGHHPGMLSNYALTLMAIHYLIQTKVSPCLSELPSNRVEINGWDCSFSTPSGQEEREISVEELLTGFFTYFTSEFDFKAHACCVHTSATVCKADVCNTELPLCIQDPFERSHILSHHVTPRGLDHFISECQATLVVLTQYNKPPGAAVDCNVNNWGLVIMMQHSSRRPQLMSLTVDCLKNLLRNFQTNRPQLSSLLAQDAAVSCLHSLLFVVCVMLSDDLGCDVCLVDGKPVPQETESLSAVTLSQQTEERKVMNKKRTCLAVQCSMNERSWVKRRQQKRAVQKAEAVAQESTSPLLKIRVYVSEYRSSDKKCVYDVHFEPCYSPHPEDFPLFFAYFKKTVLALARQLADS